MTAPARRAGRRPAGRLFVLLVLAVLAGVLGMHALAPGGVSAAETGHAMVVAAADDVPHADAGCSHTDGGSGHLAHADGTCAAAGTSAAYTPPALADAVLDVPAAAFPVVAATGWTHAGRAPPDLSELQLLRI
ncbi:DUF6153 family protein [Streptomyces kroppenstedtii]|jgi:hypothetical protein|uniref:DUF6153 family protein n=1 Tax=Streptomyces kroppenstedtii TaxID=3051181 RepID=UPI0028D0A9A1|nr:DUF6153 family protein [Streptomyces sp. DSM 40484]